MAHACVARRSKRATVQRNVRGPFPDFRRFARARGGGGACCRACAPNSSGAGSTALWCRAPTASRTNICRRARSGSPGSPASPVRPACGVVLAERAVLFVDGRYTVQAASASRRVSFSPSSIWSISRPSNGWSKISKAAPSSATIPGCTPPKASRSCARPAPPPAPTLVAVDGNPIDALWSDRPAPPAGPVSLRDVKFAGESARRQAQARAAPS